MFIYRISCICLLQIQVYGPKERPSKVFYNIVTLTRQFAWHIGYTVITVPSALSYMHETLWSAVEISI